MLTIIKDKQRKTHRQRSGRSALGWGKVGVLEELSKKEGKERELMDIDNSMGEQGWVKVEEGIEGIKGDEKVK